MYFNVLSVEERPLPLYSYFSIYVIVTLYDDGRQKWPKHEVEDI